MAGDRHGIAAVPLRSPIQNAQILHFVQDDNESQACHPERSEGSVQIGRGNTAIFAIRSVVPPCSLWACRPHLAENNPLDCFPGARCPYSLLPCITHRSFTSFRMTANHKPVILNEVKDLCILERATRQSSQSALPFPVPYGPAGPISLTTIRWIVFRALDVPVPFFLANTQILRFIPDDNESQACHPERSEGSVQIGKGNTAIFAIRSAVPP